MKYLVITAGIAGLLLLSGCSGCGGSKKADKGEENAPPPEVEKPEPCRLARDVPLPWPNPVKIVQERLDAVSELRTRLSPIREEMVKRLEGNWAGGANPETVDSLLDAAVELYWVGCHGDNRSIALAAAYMSRLGLRNYELAGTDGGVKGNPCRFRSEALRNQVAARALVEILSDHGTDQEAVTAAKMILNIVEGEIQFIRDEMYNAEHGTHGINLPIKDRIEQQSVWYKSLYLKKYGGVKLPKSGRLIRW